MSKAFTRESDDTPDQPLARPPSLPPGEKNYLTPGGAQRLREELERLEQAKKPRLANMEQRIAYLHQSLQSAVIVPPPPEPHTQVRFGATITVRDKSGAELRYRIVGIDETDTDRDWVSWRSPIARALLNAQIGQRIRFRIPAGDQEWEIIAIDYEGG